MRIIFRSNSKKKAIYFIVSLMFFMFTACGSSNATEKTIFENDYVKDFEVIESIQNQEDELKTSESCAENEFFKEAEINEKLELETEETLEIEQTEETLNETELILERVIDKDGKMVAITFDDGPSEKYTQIILDVLETHNALATFFELGYLVERHPDIILDEYEAGHEIGNHSFSHVDMRKASYEEVMEEITKTNEAIEAIIGKTPIYLRPPYGNLNKAALSASGMHVILWSIDTRDWESKSEEKIMKVIKEKDNLDGHVILMHSTKKVTTEVLDELLTYLEENDYQCVTVSELFEYKYGIVPKEGSTYGYTFFHSAQNN